MNIRFLLSCCLGMAYLLASMNKVSQASTVKGSLSAGSTFPHSSLVHGKINALPVHNELVDGISYLPLVLKNFPLIPDAPVLDDINNPDGDGSYTISWSPSIGADMYSLEEDDNIAFSSSATVYSGSSISTIINGRVVGIYYYRVRASNTYGNSAWSNIISAEVTVAPPECPQAGEWSGTTSQGGHIYFDVDDSPQCIVTNLSIRTKNCFPGEDYFTTTYWTGWVFPIVNNSFSTGPGYDQVTGSFSSFSTANGDFSIRYTRLSQYPYTCQSVGTWDAHP